MILKNLEEKMTALDYSVRMLRIAAAAADEQKASDIIAIDVSDALGITDAFLLASATSARHMNAIAEEIEKQLALQGNAEPREREGVGDESWSHFCVALAYTLKDQVVCYSFSTSS